ncbi:MAG: hypothetical protein HY897_18120 [Deltaproteobacteria bacterium]|nr:hypothetical protein [Deltaproteobacteria bacterium]
MTVFVVKVTAMAVRGEYPDGDAVLQEGRDVILLQAAAKTAGCFVVSGPGSGRAGAPGRVQPSQPKAAASAE